MAMKQEITFAKEPPLYAAGWGWNSGGRAGSITDDELRVPKQLQRSTLKDEAFIGCAAGKHHTLLVSNEGKIYALGEGRRGQLGFGNQFTGPLQKGGVYQAIPKLVTPSGAYNNRQDLKICQVACGGSFSVARELSIEEGVDLVIGFRELEEALISLRSRFMESESIQHAYSVARQERFKISTQASGQLLVWGTGDHGELGLGVLGNLSIYPQPVWKLRNTCISHIAAGQRHVLAVDNQGRLFSWGCGRGGRLGHGDFLDRNRPEIITFFGSLYVESCAAGDAHSAVLTTQRAGKRDQQTRRICTFGRGAHGRLGNGTNRNICNPILVSQWLPSLQKVQFHQVACGGAHTLALASQVVRQCIANPRGLETFVVAWGYGKNGQLGTGYRYDSFVPVKARMPRWDIITEISAGRSWSMAKSAGGELYTWGKGLRGQLGQNTEKFCLAPKKIESFASFVHISSGYAHNVAIMTPKKFHNTILTEQLAREQGEAYHPLENFTKATLKKRHSTSEYAFDCCRRLICSDVAPWRRTVRFQCLDCNISNICILCARLCHRNHRVKDNESPPAHALGEVDQEEAPSAMGVMSYKCSVLYLSHSNALRPRKGSLECMPRVSILDCNHRLKKLVPPEPGKKPVVRRRNRESNKENEVNQIYLEVNRELHTFVKSYKSPATPKSPPRKRNSRSPAKATRKTPSSPQPRTKKILSIALPSDPTPTPSVQAARVPCCRCGVFHLPCKLIPMIPESPEEHRLHLQEVEMLSQLVAAAPTVLASVKLTATKPSSRKTVRAPPAVFTPTIIPDSPRTLDKKRLSVQPAGPNGRKKRKAADDQARDPSALRDHLLRRVFGVRVLAAQRIQRAARGYIRRRKERTERLKYILLRREVCSDHYHKHILGVIFNKVRKEYVNYREEEEQAGMSYEEDLTRKYTYYIKLQQGIIGIEALTYGMRKLVGTMTPLLPRVDFDGTVTDQWRPTFAFSHHSLRAQQMRLHPLQRVSTTMLAFASRLLPRCAEGKLKEGGFTDSDLSLFTDRFMKDVRSEGWRHNMAMIALRQEEMRKKIAAIALERLKAKQNATKLMMQQAEALTLKNKQMAQGAPPGPPPGPPPRYMVLRAAQEAKTEKSRKFRQSVRDQQHLEDADFRITEKGVETKWRQRRHSISDPCELYGRVAGMREKISESNKIKRRSSLPGRTSAMYLPSQPSPKERIEQIQESLSLFHQRLNNLKKVDSNINKSRVSAAYVQSGKRRTKDTYVHWSHRIFQGALLNPRLPIEMNTILTNGYRRRTIAEPERLARQLSVMMDTREAFSTFVESAMENFAFSRRRRSFDHGEYVDGERGIEDTLGFSYEEVKKVNATVTGLSKDSYRMEEMMVKAKFMEPTRRANNAEQELDLTNSLANRFASVNPANIAASIKKGGSRKDKGRGSVLSNVRIAAAPVSTQGFNEVPVESAFFPTAAGDFAEEYEEQPSEDYGPEDPTAYITDQGYGSEYDQQYQAVALANSGEEESALASWGGEAGAHVWQEHYTEDGQAYFYNISSGQSSWDLPTHLYTQIESQNQDENGNWYWFNNVTGESKWM